jgi:cytochrome c-type biogenesis protein CcsB
VQVVSIVARGIAAQRVPWGNMYEYSTLLTALVVGAYLIVVEWRYKVRSLGGFVLIFVVLTMGVAITFLDVAPGPLAPALNSYWLKIHVVAAILGSSLLALGSGILTPLYLFQSRRERRTPVAPAGGPPPIMGGSTHLEAPAGSSKEDPLHFEQGADEAAMAAGAPAPGERKGRLPGADVIDRLAYKTIAFAFPIWTFAIIAGAIWAERAWGRYWGWDPKETGSFVTWVIFAAYLHARATAGWKGRKAALVALVGFVSLLFTYYAVNLWIVGLHSYKGF